MSIGSDITALNRRSSASPARATAEGAVSGKKPLRLSLLISRSIRLRAFAEEKPHQEGGAYISDAMFVALATLCDCGGGKPCERKTLRAYMEEAQEAKTCSMCALMPRSELISTPKTLSVVTRTAPWIIGLLGGMTLRRALIKTISFVVF